MEFNETTFFIRDDSPKLQWRFLGSRENGPGWLQLTALDGAYPSISFHLPDDRKARAAVLADMRSSLNKAIDEAEVGVDAEAVEAETAEVAG